MKNLSDTTFGEIFAAYRKAAHLQRAATQSPAASTVRNVLQDVAMLLRHTGLDETSPVMALSQDALNKATCALLEKGMKPVSIRTAYQHLNALFAKWTRPYHAKILSLTELPTKVFDTPSIRVPPQRYSPPSPALVTTVKEWYMRLARASATEIEALKMYLAATFMLEFAVRNGDIPRLRWSNVVSRGTELFLRYAPHKTALSSGRIVCWPIHRDIVASLESLQSQTKSDFLLPGAAHYIKLVARDMRALGFRGTKSAYELRKLCIHNVYVHFGAEMATSISGDDIRTILKYYADPSIPNIGSTRILDLL